MHLFWVGLLLSFSLCLDIGVVNLAILRTGLQRGFLSGFLIGLGSSFGDLVYAVLSTFGITLLFQWTVIRWVLWLGGTAVLVWFAFKMLKETVGGTLWQRTDNTSIATPGSHGRQFWLGLGLALASPTAILWFASVGGSVIVTETQGRAHHIGWFYGGFFAASVTWSAFAALVGGALHRGFSPNYVRILSGISAALFVYFAVRVCIGGYITLIIQHD